MVALLVGRASAAPTQGLSLRLDDTVTHSLSELRVQEDARAAPREAAELRRRIARLNERLHLQDASRKLLAARLAERTRLLASLRRLAAAQEQAAQLLQRPRPRAVLPAAVATPGPATEVAPPTPITTPTPVAPESSHFASGLIVDAILIAIIVALFGWVLFLRARYATQTAALQELAGGGALMSSRSSDQSPQAYASANSEQSSVGTPGALSARAQRMPRANSEPVIGIDPAGENAPYSDMRGAPMRTVAMRIPADQDALREIDTLIAYEDYTTAERRLDELMIANPGNPEYHLRLLHLQAAAGDETQSAAEERVLAAMMDGPLSETINRVREIGRGLMPGHPLFDDAEQAAAARELIARHAPPKATRQAVEKRSERG